MACSPTTLMRTALGANQRRRGATPEWSSHSLARPAQRPVTCAAPAIQPMNADVLFRSRSHAPVVLAEWLASAELAGLEASTEWMEWEALAVFAGWTEWETSVALAGWVELEAPVVRIRD